MITKEEFEEKILKITEMLEDLLKEIELDNSERNMANYDSWSYSTCRSIISYLKDEFYSIAFASKK